MSNDIGMNIQCDMCKNTIRIDTGNEDFSRILMLQRDGARAAAELSSKNLLTYERAEIVRLKNENRFLKEQLDKCRKLSN